MACVREDIGFITGGMKLPLSVFMFSALALSSVPASEAIPPGDVPGPVAAAVAEYLPGAEITSAKADEDDGRVTYELRVDYKDLVLRVDATSRGRIREIDLDGGFQGVKSLLSREVPVSVGKLPAQVASAVADCFPEAEILSAGQGERDGRRYYKVNVEHKDLTLTMNVSGRGDILDIDTVKR
jgi:hypothetical protein